MKERPILFSEPMVKAILVDRKTQTRRVVKPNLITAADVAGESWGPEGDEKYWASLCPYGQPGDRLWVRETFRLFDATNECACYDDCVCGRHHGKPVYRADDNDPDAKWRPSIFMPRWASRITLEIVSIRVERLNDISEEDAMKEGANRGLWDRSTMTLISPTDESGEAYATRKAGFAFLWESINGPGSWERNDRVWVVEFRRLQQ